MKEGTVRQPQQHMPIISATQEAETRGLKIQGQSGQLSETQSQNKKDWK